MSLNTWICYGLISMCIYTMVDAPPSSLLDSTSSLKGKDSKRRRSSGALLDLQHYAFGVGTSHRLTRTHMTHHGPDSRGVTTIFPIVFSVLFRHAHTQVVVCPGTPKVESRNCPGFGLPGLWDIIASRPNLRLGRGLNQTCSPLWELSNAVSHSPSARREQVDS
jgi:hypothetical protein